MRPGKVVTIRVNPTDCLSVIDICQAAGLVVTDQSYPSLVSYALSALLQAARDSKAIPIRDGFEYGQMMQPFEYDGRTGKNQRRATNITLQSSDITAPRINPVVAIAEAPKEEVSYAIKRARTNLQELELKRVHDKGNMTEQEVAQWFELFPIVYPDDDANFYWSN